MNRFKILFLFLGLALIAKTSAQNVSDLPVNSAPFNFTGYSAIAFDNRYEGIKGSFTFLDEFKNGVVEMKKGTFNNAILNYDALTDNLLAKSEKIGIVQLRKDMVSRFVLKSDSVDYSFVKMTIKESPTFLLEVVNDSISFYCKTTKTIKKADIGGTYNASETRYDEFIASNTFYFRKGQEKLVEIQKNKKGLLKAFPEFETELSDFLKKNKIDTNDYHHMKSVGRFINTLKRGKT